jgi:hypothetical protein
MPGRWREGRSNSGPCHTAPKPLLCTLLQTGSRPGLFTGLLAIKASTYTDGVACCLCTGSASAATRAAGCSAPRLGRGDGRGIWLLGFEDAHHHKPGERGFEASQDSSSNDWVSFVVCVLCVLATAAAELKPPVTRYAVTVVVVPTSLAVAPGTLSAGARGPTDPRVRLSSLADCASHSRVARSDGVSCDGVRVCSGLRAVRSPVAAAAGLRYRFGREITDNQCVHETSNNGTLLMSHVCLIVYYLLLTCCSRTCTAELACSCTRLGSSELATVRSTHDDGPTGAALGRLASRFGRGAGHGAWAAPSR